MAGGIEIAVPDSEAPEALGIRGGGGTGRPEGCRLLRASTEDCEVFSDPHAPGRFRTISDRARAIRR
jgi:hypothetical protein